ncbi:inclusion body family protein [Nitrospirillum sp. BR 11163]|uniref:inclusion body family protein n=1 Tax=Nitrospirillum sp. BR 11163 TaxID=3104323 RepID=UPI002AFF47DE|nr:inclusion body family protein [Nitrospirillum sp. BR 11163]MEA1673497.1 inclusion body family protein [Nitrospirillum sp. BR 11163]
MSKFIDIEIVIDTVTLLSTYPNPSKNANAPTGIAHNFSYMIAQSAFVRSGQATGDLNINALVNDTIRWRSLSLSGNSDQSVVLYDIRQFSGTQVTGTITAIESNPYEPKPTLVDGKNTNPPTFTTVTDLDYYLQTTVINHGTENYQVYFYVTQPNPSTGQPQLVGYFYWDPTITVA